MENWVDLLARTYELVRAPVARLDDTLLARPTPCPQWCVQDLFEHVIGTIYKFGSAAVSSSEPSVDSFAECGPAERFDATVVRNLAAWASLKDWSATLTLPFGEFPAEVAAGINQLDVLVHSWDLGASLGLAVALPDYLAETAMRMARARVPLGRGRVFGAEAAAHGSTAGESCSRSPGRIQRPGRPPIDLVRGWDTEAQSSPPERCTAPGERVALN